MPLTEINVKLKVPGRSLIVHFAFVASLNYILTCVPYVELCNSACREAEPPHLFGLFCVPSCALACRGTARTPLTLSVLRMWTRTHRRTITRVLVRPRRSLVPLVQDVKCKRAVYRVDGSSVWLRGCPLVVAI